MGEESDVGKEEGGIKELFPVWGNPRGKARADKERKWSHPRERDRRRTAG